MSLLNQLAKTISFFFFPFLLKILPTLPLTLSQLSVHICAIKPIIFKPFGQLVVR